MARRGLMLVLLAGCATAPPPPPSGCYVFLSKQCGLPDQGSYTVISPVFALPVDGCPPDGDLEGTADGGFNGWDVAGLAENAAARAQVAAYAEWMKELRAPCTAFEGEDRSSWARFSRSAEAILRDNAKLSASWKKHGYRGGCAAGYTAPGAVKALPSAICP